MLVKMKNIALLRHCPDDINHELAEHWHSKSSSKGREDIRTHFGPHTNSQNRCQNVGSKHTKNAFAALVLHAADPAEERTVLPDPVSSFFGRRRKVRGRKEEGRNMKKEGGCEGKRKGRRDMKKGKKREKEIGEGKGAENLDQLCPLPLNLGYASG